MNHVSLRFLLVEENDVDARLVELMIRASPVKHLEISRVVRLSEALEHLSRNETDLVLLDLNLPDTSGLEGVVPLRKAAPHVPIIILTGTNDAMLGIQAFEKGAMSYMVKGKVDPWLFANTVKRAMESRYKQEPSLSGTPSVSHKGPAGVEEKREWPRFRITEATATLSFYGGPDRVGHVREEPVYSVIDLSDAGMRVLSPRRLEPGTTFDVKIETVGEMEAIDAIAEVCWCEKHPEEGQGFNVGVSITILDDKRATQIAIMREWIEALESKASYLSRQSGGGG